MTREEFEQLYAKARGRAVAAAQRVTGNAEVAEDAVQEAAMYILQRIEAQELTQVTESYFIQLATSRAKDAVRPTGVRHGSGKLPIVRADGDLEATEIAMVRYRTGVDRGQRTPPAPRAE